MMSNFTEYAPSDSEKALARRHGMDWERIKRAIDDEALTLDRYTAENIVSAHLRCHGYPEPLIVPAPELCPSCFTPKSPCSCGAFPIKPQVPPDVPGWMGKALTAGEAREALDALDRSARAGDREHAGPFTTAKEATDWFRGKAEEHGKAMAKVLRRCKVVDDGWKQENLEKARSIAPEHVSKMLGEPTWDNPGPCVCGANCSETIAKCGFYGLKCIPCGRGTGAHDTKALALSAWVNREAGSRGTL